MRRQGLQTLSLMGLLAWPTAYAGAILSTDFGPQSHTETFETLNSGGEGGFAAPLSLNGNTFATSSGWIRSFEPSGGSVSQVCIGGSPEGHAPNPGTCIGTGLEDLETMDIILGSPSIRAGLWVGLTERQSEPQFWSRALVSFFDESDAILGSIEIYDYTFGFAGWDVGPPGHKARIKRISIADIASNNRVVAIDNLMWELRPVPEPGSLTLLVLGLIGLGVCRRRSISPGD
jgi:hypothetical protein